MGQITIPPKVKLIAGLLFNDKIKYEDVINILERNFGGIDCKSEIINFNFTDYYNKEMGVVIFRQYLAFKNLIDAVELADIKILTNKIEEEFSIDNKR
ncbi:MAG TPA: DUF4416 family protein, partial [bacterium]|nr:DUF4416 family protein [bacterium]